MRTPQDVEITYIGNCSELPASFVDKQMDKAARANKKNINRLVKQQYPDIFESLDLSFYNPFDYYKNDKFLILRHSAIGYFFKYV
jgi:hypothetical protein